jgi:phosphoribosylformimino-5-aminoimidazole carboxamide ribotide isomerase
MRFRPCIDLHGGQVKQIVGSSLRDGETPQTNFTAAAPPEHFASRYRADGLGGGHVIMLGPGNEAAAIAALGAFPDGLQLGGGINPDNAAMWLERGAERVIATSYVFADGQLHWDRLEKLAATVDPSRLVLDLSCAPGPGGYHVMSDRWQRQTDLIVDAKSLALLAKYCAEFLIHATQVEGKRQGIDTELVRLLGDATPLPTTYAGGIRDWDDIAALRRYGQDRLNYTVGSALDIFGGDDIAYDELVAYDQQETQRHRS